MRLYPVFATALTALTLALPLSLPGEAAQQLSQLPENPLPGSPAELPAEDYIFTIPSLEDAFSRAQQAGETAVSSGAPYDPLSVCQGLRGSYAQQCMAGYNEGYGADLTSDEINVYYYDQGYNQGTADAQAQKPYNPYAGGLQLLENSTTRRQWSNGYHNGYWEHAEATP